MALLKQRRETRMKKKLNKLLRVFVLPFVILFVLASSSMADFKDPLDYGAIEQEKPLNKPFIDSAKSGHTLVVVGPRGLILYSNDGGGKWAQAQVPVQSDLVAIDMVNESKGWAVGHDGVILATTDGGATWVKQLDGRMASKQFINYYSKRLKQGDSSVEKALELTELNYRDGPALPFLDVWFRDELTGFAVGGFGNIARTDDGGKTWTPWTDRIANESGFHLTSVVGIGDDVFIGSERGVLFRLNAERQLFEIIETGYSGSFTGITGANGLIIAYGLGGAAYQSTDRGNTWTEVKDLPRSTINDAFRRSNDKGYIFANQSGKLVISDKNFENLEVIDCGEPVSFTSILEISDRELLVTDLQGLSKVSLVDHKMTRVTSQE
ncbi:glycosyl hydrolase [Pseudomonas sp. BN102]|nr:glycosyl hydrolase [Pseudomonas sp. BN102]